MKFKVKRGTYIQFQNKMIQLKQGKIYDTEDFIEVKQILETIIKRNKDNFEIITEEENIIEEPEQINTEQVEEEKVLETTDEVIEENNTEEVNIDKMTKKELIEYQKEIGLEVSDDMSKSEIKRMIKEMR